MALTVNHPLLREQRIHAYSPSIGATPVAAYGGAAFRGKITKFTCITGGTITTADCTVTVAVNGTTIGTITVTSAGAAAGQLFSGTPTSAALAAVNEDDVVSFTPAGASGATVPGKFAAVVQMA